MSILFLAAKLENRPELPMASRLLPVVAQHLGRPGKPQEEKGEEGLENRSTEIRRFLVLHLDAEFSSKTEIFWVDCFGLRVRNGMRLFGKVNATFQRKVRRVPWTLPDYARKPESFIRYIRLQKVMRLEIHNVNFHLNLVQTVQNLKENKLT